jgi:hypothetical protein
MNRFNALFRPLTFFVLCVPLAFGCGPKTLKQARTYPVQGKVLLDGEPAAYVHIDLEPMDAAQGGAPADGQTDGEGHFELRTFSNNEDPDGAVPGRYRLVVEDHTQTDGVVVAFPKDATPTLIPPGSKYENEIEIKADNSNDLQITVTSNKAQ